jgi:hypothetical protein
VKDAMTDYKLDGLSPRLFEHIIQELAIGVPMRGSRNGWVRMTFIRTYGRA